RNAECGMRIAESYEAAISGIKWLLNLQNRDGGIPTFCRGWGALPFDRSAPDLTAHAIRAWLFWFEEMPFDLQKKIGKAIERAIKFLKTNQRENGAWIPLWFGNHFSLDDENPTYGTSRVLLALAEFQTVIATFTLPGGADFLSARNLKVASATAMNRGIQWLLSAQNKNGSWPDSSNEIGSIEETALAIEALAAVFFVSPSKPIEAAICAGTNWLIELVESGEWKKPAPIGFYFSKLWYYEKLYPQIFTVAALGKVISTKI
ncbi:MAG: hypothetical protein ACR2H1_05770, partial [Limisphaerales bacterium]